MMSIRFSPRSIGTTMALVTGWFACASAAESSVTYKCPGNHYSNTMSAKEAKDKGCKLLDNAPISVIQGYKPKPASNQASGSTTGASSTRIDPAEQRARDSDARRILEGELKREEERLATMKAEFKGGEPDRQGDEQKNYQRYLDRVSDMKSAIARKEGDIAAIKREIAKQPQ